MVEGFNATQRELEILELRKEVSALKTNVEYWRLAAERRDTRKELTGLDVPEARTLDAPEPPQCEVRTAEAFDSWFDGNFLDPDGGSSHLPDWFRGDMQRAWDAGRFAQEASGCGDPSCKDQNCTYGSGPTEAQIEAGARAIADYLTASDGGQSFDEMPEWSQREASETSRVCLEAALSVPSAQSNSGGGDAGTR